MNGQQNGPNLVERLANLEFQMSKVNAIEALSNNLRYSLNEVVELYTELVDELGLGVQISQRLNQKRVDENKVKAARTAERLQQLIDSGQVVEVSTIDSGSIIVGTEKSTNPEAPDEVIRTNLSGFRTDIRDELIGKSTGYVVTRDGRPVFTIEKVYNVLPIPPVKLAEVPEETPPPAPEVPPVAPEAPVETSVEQPAAETEAPAPVTE